MLFRNNDDERGVNRPGFRGAEEPSPDDRLDQDDQRQQEPEAAEEEIGEAASESGVRSFASDAVVFCPFRFCQGDAIPGFLKLNNKEPTSDGFCGQFVERDIARRAIPIKAYRCRKCGYVIMYGSSWFGLS